MRVVSSNYNSIGAAITCSGGLLVRVGQMLLEILGHTEGLHLLLAEDGGHGGVRGEELLVLRILEVVLLQVGKEPLDALRPGDLLPLLGPDDGGEFLGDIQLHVDTSLLCKGHFKVVWIWIWFRSETMF